MDEYELLGGLHEIIDADVDKKIQEWIENHDVNYWLVYPLIMVELGAMNEEPQTTMNLLKRCVTSFVYAKALKMEKKFYLKRINIPGLRRYIREYENVLVKIYQNYRFSREINDINPVSKPRLKEIEEHKYELTTCLVSDRYNEENMYFFGADDSERNELEYKQIMALHGKFFRKIFEEKRKFDELEKYVDKMLYQGCIEIIEKDLKKWASNVRSVVFDNPKQLAKVIAFFYYQSVLRSIRIRIETLEDETYMDNATSILMVFNKKECIQDIATVSELKLPIVDRIVNYFVNKGNTNLMEFPLFEIEDNIITIPSLFIVNDWQFTVINGHYAKEKVIKNREKTLSIVTEGRIEETLKNVTNIAVSKTWPYSYTDNDGKIQCSDIDFAIYDKIRNVILVIEAKWIDKHYEDEIDKRYGKILNTLNSIFSKQIKKHREFLSKRENIDLLFKNDKRYVQSEEFPTIYYLAVDKRNQMHIDDRHMVSEYMIIYFLKKYINNNELDLSTLWDEISRLKTKFEYITISSDYHEVKVGDDTVLIEKADLYLND